MKAICKKKKKKKKLGLYQNDYYQALPQQNQFKDKLLEQNFKVEKKS